MRNIKNLLGKRIKELRKNKGLTQDKLAELSGIETPSMSNIENGKNYPNHETLDKISFALGVKPYELYLFEHFLPHDEILKEMTNAMQNDYELTKKMYKYFVLTR